MRPRIHGSRRAHNLVQRNLVGCGDPLGRRCHAPPVRPAGAAREVRARIALVHVRAQPRSQGGVPSATASVSTRDPQRRTQNRSVTHPSRSTPIT